MAMVANTVSILANVFYKAVTAAKRLAYVGDGCRKRCFNRLRIADIAYITYNNGKKPILNIDIGFTHSRLGKSNKSQK